MQLANHIEMLTIQLKEFIKTGAFGPIRIGSTKTELIKLFGKKYDFGNFGESQIIKYGWYEFFYLTHSEEIFGIQNDHLLFNNLDHSATIHYKNSFFTIDTWFLKENNNITFDQMESILQNENITYTIKPAYSGSDERIIECVNSKVTFDFTDEYTWHETDSRGTITNYKEQKITDGNQFILNGIRLFNY